MTKVLCEQLPYGVKIRIEYPFVEEKDWHPEDLYGLDLRRQVIADTSIRIEEFKPYLRPMSSMTEDEAKHLFLLHNEDRKEWEILEVSIGEKYVDFKIDDGCCSFENYTIWYEDAVSSTKSLDWLNECHFDFRGLIPMGLAIAAAGRDNPYNEKGD